MINLDLTQLISLANEWDIYGIEFFQHANSIFSQLASWADKYNELVSIVVAPLTLIAILIAYWQLKRAKDTLNYDAYQRVYSAYETIYSNLISHKGIRKYYREKWQLWEEDKQTAYYFFELLYSLISRVWVLYRKGTLPKEEWLVWEEWLKQLVPNELFKQVHKENKGYYQDDFWNLVDELIKLKEANLQQT